MSVFLQDQDFLWVCFPILLGRISESFLRAPMAFRTYLKSLLPKWKIILIACISVSFSPPLFLTKLVIALMVCGTCLSPRLGRSQCLLKARHKAENKNGMFLSPWRPHSQDEYYYGWRHKSGDSFMSGSARNSPKGLLDLIATVRGSFCMDRFVILCKRLHSSKLNNLLLTLSHFDLPRCSAIAYTQPIQNGTQYSHMTKMGTFSVVSERIITVIEADVQIIFCAYFPLLVS